MGSSKHFGETEEEKELKQLYLDRLKDRKNLYPSRRKRQVDSSPKRMGELLELLFKKDPAALVRIEENRALLAWKNYVGTGAARLSQAQRIRNRTLIVRVADPLWMQQLSLLKHAILKKYHRDFPRLGLKDIFFTRN